MRRISVDMLCAVLASAFATFLFWGLMKGDRECFEHFFFFALGALITYANTERIAIVPEGKPEILERHEHV